MVTPYKDPSLSLMLMIGVRLMLNDPEEYTDPFSFKPERFIPENGKRLPMDPEKVAFGFGRRYVYDSGLSIHLLELRVDFALEDMSRTIWYVDI